MGNVGLYVHDKEGNLVIDMAGNPVLDKAYGYGRSQLYRDVESPYWGGMVFRCNPDGSEFEVLAHNFRNNYDVTVDSLGGLWQSDNDDDGSSGCRLNYVMEFGNFGYLDEFTGAGLGVRRTGMNEEIPKRQWHQNDPGVVPNLYVTGAGAPTGALTYEGRLLPEIFWDQVLHCDHGPGVVWSPVVTKDGAGYSAELVTLLIGDRVKWVRPVDVAVTPDGAVFVSDWYDPVTSWNRMYDLERGRIFRLAPPGHRSHVPEFDFDTPEGAVEALKSPTYSVRYLAWTALNKMQEKAEPALLELFKSSDRTRHRARALWLLSKIDGDGEKHIEMASRDEDEDIRVVSVRAARQLKMDIIPLLRRLAKDPSPQVRRECAIALRHHKSPEAPALWAELASRHDGKDRWYVEALGIAADGQWDAYLGAWLNKVSPDWNTPAGRDILWRSRAKVAPDYLAKIINSPDVDLDGTKRYLRAFDFQEESEEKIRNLRRLAFDSPESDPKKYGFAASEALFRIEHVDVDADPNVRETINRILEHVQGTEQFARLIQRYELREHYPGLMKVAVDNKDNPIGIASIRTLLGAREHEVIENCISESDVDSALSAVGLLGHSREQGSTRLLSRILENEDLNWRIREQSVRALGRSSDGIQAMINLLEAGRFPDDFREAAGAAVMGTMNVALRDEVAEHFPLPQSKSGEPIPQMTELLVYIGDTGVERKFSRRPPVTSATSSTVRGRISAPIFPRSAASLQRRAFMNPFST